MTTQKPLIARKKHLFQFQILTKDDEKISLLFPTDSNRKGKVADQILISLNTVRVEHNLPQVTRENLKEFFLRQIK